MNILVCEYDNQEDVMVINTRHSAKAIEKLLTSKGKSFSEVYEVTDNDLRFYIFDPLYADEKLDDDIEKQLLKLSS